MSIESYFGYLINKKVLKLNEMQSEILKNINEISDVFSSKNILDISKTQIKVLNTKIMKLETELIRSILESGIHPDEMKFCGYGDTILCKCCALKNIEAVKLLLEAGAEKKCDDCKKLYAEMENKKLMEGSEKLPQRTRKGL